MNVCDSSPPFQATSPISIAREDRMREGRGKDRKVWGWAEGRGGGEQDGEGTRDGGEKLGISAMKIQPD